MKILVAGSGGREHAVAWKLVSDPAGHEVLCAPGNAGTAVLPRATNIDAVSVPEMAAAAVEHGVDLVIVGPEQPLVDGLADELGRAGIPCLGPGQAAAALEGSKVFAKEFMSRHGVPTAAYEVARSPTEARAAVERLGLPVVLKADGLAAGKGVVVCRDLQTAEETIDAFMTERRLGDAGATLIVERALDGYEVTILVFTDGHSSYELPPSQDHKPVGEGNTGANTGGMGVVCPHPHFGEDARRHFRREILEPTLAGIRSEGLDYHGVLYFGLMVTADGTFVLEYNVRLGDPEAQAVLPLVEADLGNLAHATATGTLGDLAAPPPAEASCVVVAASGGYPGPYEKGFPIRGIEACEGPVFIAGVAAADGILRTNGGRVLAVCGTGPSPAEARAAAYRDIERIRFEGMFYRRDIGALGVS